MILLLVLEASKVTRMTKSELIARLAEQNPSLYHRDLEQLVNTVFETITRLWKMGIAWNSEDLVRFPYANEKLGLGGIRALANP